MSERTGPRRIFFDSGVVIDGCSSEWSAAKAVLILMVQCPREFTVVLAEPVSAEIRQALIRKTAKLGSSVRDFLQAFDRWRAYIRIETWPYPEQQAIRQYSRVLLPALRHMNDLDAAVSAVQASPDWVLSTNVAHWGPALAAVTGLAVSHPRDFLQDLSRRA